MISRENGLIGTTKEVTMRIENANYELSVADINSTILNFNCANYYLKDCHKIQGKDFTYELVFKSNKKGLK